MSAPFTTNKSQLCHYVLATEDNAWGVSLAELRRALADSRAAGRTVCALVLINPGNPTGQSLAAGAVRDVARFCADERLVLLADEV